MEMAQARSLHLLLPSYMDQLPLQISKKAACGRAGKRLVIGNQFLRQND